MALFDDITALSKKIAAAILRNEPPTALEDSGLFGETDKEHILQSLTDPTRTKERQRLLRGIDRRRDWKTVRERAQVPVRRLVYWKYAAAASLALIMGLTFFMVQKDDTVEPITAPTIVNNQIETGTDKATLTLSNGEQITLEKGQNYRTDDVRSDGEALTYTEKTADNIAYNYLTIPRGGQYQLTLADGTKVWLNSETQLKYPVAFVPGQTRAVELLHGEAYFEVSPSTEHNGAKFKVNHKQQDIEVLGTAFNVKAYKDEQNIYTTLVEGKIALEAPSTANERIIMAPGQQVDLSLEDRRVSLISVNLYDQVAWREGIFNFKRMALKDIMKVLSRWYDMDFAMDKELEGAIFTGSFNKSLPIEDVLMAIMNTGVITTYEINNKSIHIK